MTSAVFSILIAVVFIAAVVPLILQRQLVIRLRREREKILMEERRVFDFLHGLGEAFSETIRPSDLHRLIVEGACRVLNARGGTLYLVDRSNSLLLPAYLSHGCPPVTALPAHIIQQAETNANAAESYLRLHSVQPGEGIVGEVWVDGQMRHLEDASLSTDLNPPEAGPALTGSLIAVPLVYAGHRLGVLIVANGTDDPQFSEADATVFGAISEQSAFALYTAVIYSEAGEKKRLDHDLQTAREIQRILLPSGSPEVEGFEIHGLNIPARQVSGDYFDYIRVDEDRLGVVIADVSGKGIPASLIMAMCRSVIRSQAPGNPSPASVLHRVNRQLFPDIKEDMFISMAYLVLNERSGAVTLARAGHDAPLLYVRRENRVIPLSPPGMALGIDSGNVFDRLTNDCTVEMEASDCLVLYTDGVTEALDSKELEFGLDRMIRAIRDNAAEGADAILRSLTEGIRQFVGPVPQNDDITLITIRKK